MVHGSGLDEITLTGKTDVVALEGGNIREFTLARMISVWRPAVSTRSAAATASTMQPH